MQHDKNVAQQSAKRLSESILRSFKLEAPPDVGLVLGTGWGDTLKLENETSVPFQQLLLRMRQSTYQLGELPGHERRVSYGRIGDARVIALRGRVHLNEHPNDPMVPLLVRLQVQMLLELGVRRFILTNAAGSLKDDVRVGDIVVADGFVSLFAPAMPLYAGEFCSPEDTLDRRLQLIGIETESPLCRHQGGYAMMRGPFFEGRRYDKPLLRQTGAACVGMSTLPEASIIALNGAKALCLSYITNDDKEVHSHETNQARARERSQQLGDYLAKLVNAIYAEYDHHP